MFGLREPFDPASLLVILLTFVLFSVALFVKGFTHDILVEAGVFLISVKLIMMSSRITNISEDIVQKLSVICAAPGQTIRRVPPGPHWTQYMHFFSA